jgi:hypothetical protein
MSGVGKNIAQSLNLYGLGGLISLSAVPLGDIHTIAGSSAFILGIGCATVGAMLAPIKTEQAGNSLSLRKQFVAAVSATTMGGSSMAIASFVGLRDIIINSPVTFHTLSSGYAMAVGLTGFYGGLRMMNIVRSYGSLENQDLTGPG